MDPGTFIAVVILGIIGGLALLGKLMVTRRQQEYYYELYSEAYS